MRPLADGSLCTVGRGALGAWRDARSRYSALHLPGIALTGVLAWAAIELGKTAWLRSNGISVLTLAILLGMIVGNTVYPRVSSITAAGVGFAKQRLLRAGIILYGLRLTFQDVASVGIAGVVIDSIVLSSTFGLSWWAGTRLFGLDRETAMLIGPAGPYATSAPSMARTGRGGRPGQVTVAVSTVVVFGTLAIFLYPALYHLNARYPPARHVARRLRASSPAPPSTRLRRS